MCLISFQCLFVGEELYLANKFTENAISGLVLLARYISAPIALRYGTSGPRSSLYYYLEVEIYLSSHLVNELPFECLMDVLCPYKIF